MYHAMLVMPLFKRLLFNCQQPEHGGLKNLANQVAILAGAGCAKKQPSRSYTYIFRCDFSYSYASDDKILVL